MTKTEIKYFINQMNIDQLRENLYDYYLLVNQMKDALDLKNAEMLIEKDKRERERQKVKNAIQDEMNKQKKNLN